MNLRVFSPKLDKKKTKKTKQNKKTDETQILP